MKYKLVASQRAMALVLIGVIGHTQAADSDPGEMKID
jgi:hypothetical protein